MRFLLAVCLIVSLSSFSFAQAPLPPQSSAKENIWTKYVADTWKWDFILKSKNKLPSKTYVVHTEYTLPDDSRADIAEIRMDNWGSSTTVWEVDWASKWQEAIGQAIFYKAMSGADSAGIVLIVRPGNKVDILRARIAANNAKLAFVTVDQSGKVERW